MRVGEVERVQLGPVMACIVEAVGYPDARSWLSDEVLGEQPPEGLAAGELEEWLQSAPSPLRLETEPATVAFAFEEGVLAALQQLAGGGAELEVRGRYADGEVFLELRRLVRIGGHQYPVIAGCRPMKRPRLIPTLGELAGVMAELAVAFAGDLRRLEGDLAGLGL